MVVYWCQTVTQTNFKSMTLTSNIRTRLQKFNEDTGNSYYKIHQMILADGHEITYNTLRAFSADETKGNGDTLDIIDAFLTKKGY